MALITCDFFSESLEFGQSMTVVLPQATQAQVGVTPAGGADGDGPPVLYLLHGLSDDHTAWLRYTSIERYATAAGLAVVMPAVARSFYTDEAHGHAFWTFVADELPEIVSSFFRVSTRPERTYVAGLSMGGYGAVRLALARPRRYAAAASLSGALDIVRRADEPAAPRGDARSRLRRSARAGARPVRPARPCTTRRRTSPAHHLRNGGPPPRGQPGVHPPRGGQGARRDQRLPAR